MLFRSNIGNLIVVSNITVSGNLVTSSGNGGNITGANVISANTLTTTGNANIGNLTIGSGSGGNITGANVISATTFSASGNITGNYILGNGSQLTGLSSGTSNARAFGFSLVYGL